MSERSRPAHSTDLLLACNTINSLKKMSGIHLGKKVSIVRSYEF